MKKFLLSILFSFLISPAWAVTTPLVFDAAVSDDSVLHPDCKYFPVDVDGYKFWAVLTPYPADPDEKVYLFRSTDGDTWVKTGVSPNPVFDGIATYGFSYDADPDLLYIPKYGRWFLFSSPCMAGSQPNQECGIMLHTSTDGKAYTAYAGTAVNGNTNPIIQAGTSAASQYTLDSGAQAWEKKTSNNLGKTQYVTAFFDHVKDLFVIYYGETSGNADDADDGGLTNNVGVIGCSTFQWDGTNITNFTRCAGNPLISQAKDATYLFGAGHIELGQRADGTFILTGLRTKITGNATDLHYWTADSYLGPWTYQGIYEPLGADGTWNDNTLYRSSICADGYGRITQLNGREQMLMTGSDTSNNYRIGWRDDTNFGTTHTPNRLIGSGIISTGVINQ